MNSVRVYRDGGIVIEGRGKKLLVDPVATPSCKPDAVFISHAHRDHYSLRALRHLTKVPKIMSRPTLDLLSRRALLDNVVIGSPGDELEVNGIELELYEAGHVIGSLQLRVDLGESVVYTGDFNLEPRTVLKPAPILKGDVLVIDATYGHPNYRFPSRSTLYRRILELVERAKKEKRGVTIAARTLGTGQEVIALLSLVAKLTPFVHRSFYHPNRIYEKHGEVLGSYLLSRRPPPGRIAVIPLSTSARSAVACTGWAVGKGVPLSSHADYDSLINYAKASMAERVYAFSSFAKHFSYDLKRVLGVEATPL